MSSPRPSSSARGRTTRGPLPPAVYWRRRLFVLCLAGSLVLVIGGWLNGGSDGSSTETPVAEQAGAEIEVSRTVTAESTAGAGAQADAQAGATAGAKGKGRKKRAKPTPTLAAPQGTCDPADIVVTPQVGKEAVAGRDVTVALSLQTVESEACTWRVAPNTVAVKIADDGTEIWTTRHCRKVVPKQSVVVRRAVATVVEMTWDARESDEGCRRARAEWVLAGDYSIAASALGGEPVVTEFALASPTPETIHVTPKDETTGKAPKKRSRR